MRLQRLFPLFLCAFGTAAPASDDEMLRAIADGEIEFSSELALPDPDAEPDTPGNAAPTFPGTDDPLVAISQAEEEAITDRAFPFRPAQWPFGVVFVCWEDFTQSDSTYRALVREAVAGSWEANSAIEFLGWFECKPGDKGIRIAVRDEGAHVKFLGKFLDGIKDGMVLNATYQEWNLACQDFPDRCSRMIAVHEFGHAIGFAHEQNRPDTPGDCFQPAQGDDGDDILLTPWDPHSVMNYCNEEYMNDGALSAFDIKAVQFIYGRS